MDTSRESGAVSQTDNPEGSIPQVEETRIGSGSHHPNAGQISAELKRLMRSPYQRILADYLGFAPTPDAIRRLADKAPDRWIQGAVMLAQLAGYSKEVHVTGEVSHVHSMSDAQIRERRLALSQQQQSMQSPLPIPATQAGTVSRETPAMAANRAERDEVSALKAARANADAPIDVQVRVIPD